MTDNPRATMGANFPPLSPPDEVAAHIEAEHEELFSEAAKLEAERFKLPEALETDEHCNAVTAFVVKAKGVARKLDKVREAEKKPYLDAGRIVDATFGEVAKAVLAMSSRLEGSVAAYTRAKAERERAERLEKERVEREAAEAKRREEQAQREAAERAQREADEAAARIRQAADAEGRRKAEAEMREREEAAAKARAAAEASAEEAAAAERKAAAAARQAEGSTTKLSRVGGAAATASVSARWVATVVDRGALRSSIGVLGFYFTDAELDDVVARAVRMQSQGGATPTITIPGVEIAPEDKVNIRAVRA